MLGEYGHTLIAPGYVPVIQILRTRVNLPVNMPDFV